MKDYVRLAVRTETRDHAKIRGRMTRDNIRLLHGAMGLCTEAGELTDQLKRHLYYGAKLDRVNLTEEVGDLFWYCALIADTLHVPFDAIMRKNIAKLKARYGEKFRDRRAVHRDLKKERRILEKK